VVWARRLQAVAQNGLAYTGNPYDAERYEQILAVAAEMAAAGDQAEAARVLELFRAEAGYATPKVDVRGVVFRDGRLLLVHGTDDERWTMPGGWADVGESPSQAVEKEIREESGYPARAVRLLGVRNRDLRGRAPWPFHAYKVFFLCELLADEPGPRTGVETDEIGFFAEDELPELSAKVGDHGVGWLFEHHRDPSLPPAFD
jgi:ADP-ribose pyrophosphatase YjhB (NUDIX family)